jgi:anti-sigma regulatory factor (Ser/Thr protein kinase)
VRTDALLVASELTSNAVRHSGTAPTGELELRAQLVPEGVMIEVIDEGRSGDVPHTRKPDAGGPGGFGLPIIDAIALRWGADRLSGTRVWVQLQM